MISSGWSNRMPWAVYREEDAHRPLTREEVRVGTSISAVTGSR
jgi:hypothetical protein